MEGAAVALTSFRNGVPATLIKIVSDGADEDSAQDFAAVIDDGQPRLSAMERGVEKLGEVIALAIENA